MKEVIQYNLEAATHAVRLIDLLASTGAHRATKYISKDLVVRATRRRYKAYKGPKRKGFAPRMFEVQITCSRPNYTDRAYLKRLGIVPVGIQLKY